MENRFDELAALLDSELRIQNELIGNAESFNKAIKENDLYSMQLQSSKHDTQLCLLEKLEESRIACCRELSKSLGFATSEPKLASLIDKAPEQAGKKLSNLHKSLKESVSSLSKINTSNRILLEESLNMISATFSMIQQSSKKYNPYGAKGRNSTASAGHLIINRIA
jgi:flagellar biosynthesis/type III secretory pathway chaperone